jgi:hypothetical protein
VQTELANKVDDFASHTKLVNPKSFDQNNYDEKKKNYNKSKYLPK